MQSRLAAVALLVVVLVAVAVFAVVPVAGIYLDDREAIEDAQFRIERFRRLAAKVDVLEQQLDELDSDRSLQTSLMDEASPTLAAAGLQARLKQIVERSGGRLASTQVLSPENEEGLERVAISVRLSLTGPALQRVLHDLESGLPVLLVDEVVIAARGSRRPRRSRRRREGQTEVPAPVAETRLDVRFRLSGFRRPALEQGA